MLDCIYITRWYTVPTISSTKFDLNSVTVVNISFNKRRLHSQEFNKNCCNNLRYRHSTFYRRMCCCNVALNSSYCHQTTDIVFQLQITATCNHSFYRNLRIPNWKVGEFMITVAHISLCKPRGYVLSLCIQHIKLTWKLQDSEQGTSH